MKKILIIFLLLPFLGRAQITLVKDNFQQISAFMQYNNQLFFYAYDGTNAGLWKTDGTTAGTVFVKETMQIQFSGSSQPTVSGGLLYFTDGASVLWRTDGTTNGTFALTPNAGGGAIVYNMIDLNGILIFAYQAGYGIELYRTDGTVAGTSLIVDFFTGSQSGVHGNIFNMAKQGNYVYFVGQNYTHSNPTLCRTDGTAGGTQIVPNAGLFPQSDLAMVGDKIIYTAQVDYTYNCVGTEPQTGIASQKRIMKVENGICSILTNPGTFYGGDYPNGIYCGLHFGNDFGYIQIFRKSGNKLFFRGTHYPVYGVNNSTDALWVTDGTSSQLLKIFPSYIYAGREAAMETYYWSRPVSTDNSFLGNIFYFVAGDDNTGYEVWRSDGTVAGTFLLKDIYAGVGSSDPNDFRTVNGLTYFIARESTNGGNSSRIKLFQTDGTTAGTVPVSNPMDVHPYEIQLTSANNNSNKASNAIGSKFLFVGTTPYNSTNPITGTGLFSVCTPPIAPTIVSSVGSPICEGQTTILTSTCVGNSTWNTGATTSSIAVSPNTDTNYTVTCTNSCGTSAAGSFYLRVTALPTIPTFVTRTVTICPSNSVTLLATNCNGTMQWSNGSTSTPFIVSEPGVYTATCTNGCGTSQPSHTFTVRNPDIIENLTGTSKFGQTDAIQTINSTQTVSIGYNSTYKAGRSITLNPNFTANTGSIFKAEIGNPCPITNGLVASYNLDNNFTDISGNGHNATFASAILTTGRKGIASTAYSFNGINHRINLGSWFNLQEFTISMWVNTGTTQANAYAMIFDNNHTNNISWNTQQDNLITNQYSFGVSGSPGGGVGYTLNPNVWEHLILMKGNGYIKVYKNGLLIGTASHTGIINYTSTVPSLSLGAFHNNGNPVRFWAGSMDDIKIYNRALSAVEVSYLYNE